jgi:hypothetical protein
MAAGRPSEYNLDIACDICEQVAAGANVMDALNKNDLYPSWPTFRRWKRDHAELRTLYINAIQDKSEAVLFEIDQTVQELKEGDFDASTANVIIQTLKWKAAKFYPKMFGDQKNVDVTTKGQSINAPLTPEEAAKLAKDIEDDY